MTIKPPVIIGGIGTLVAAILGLLTEFGIPLSDTQKESILVVIAAIVPILTGIITQTNQTHSETITPNGRHAMTDIPGEDLPDPADQADAVPPDQTPQAYHGAEWDDEPSDEDREPVDPSDDLDVTEDYDSDAYTDLSEEETHGQPDPRS